jgi:hypothetical protein
MNTPYTTKTGLKIGSRHGENGITMQIDDKDMLFLQEALLAKPKSSKDRIIAKYMVKFLILTVLVVLFSKLIVR